MPVPTLLNYKKKDLWPQTSIDLVIDPKTGKPIDLSQFVTVNDAVGKNYTINGNSADENGNFTITAESIGAADANHTHTLASLDAASASHTHSLESLGAASANHTHTLASLGAASAVHNHEISEINGLEQILLNIGPGGEGGQGGDGISFDVIPLTSQSYPEPSSWNQPGE